MKRHWKKVLLGLVAVALVVGGYLLYQFQFKEYDVADEEVEKITEEDYTIELPDGTTIGDPEQGSAEEGDVASGDESGKGESGAGAGTSDGGDNSNTGTDKIVSIEDTPGGAGSAAVAGVTQASSDKQATGSQATGSSEGTSSSSKAGAGSGAEAGSADSSQPSGSKPTVAAIKSKYEPSFASLQSQAHGKINSLVGRAKAEYSEKKSNGESISYGYFYQKYMGAAASLEGQTDAVFNQLIGAVESELQANGYSKEYAQSFRDQYQSEKEAMRSSLISSAMNR